MRICSNLLKCEFEAKWNQLKVQKAKELWDSRIYTTRGTLSNPLKESSRMHFQSFNQIKEKSIFNPNLFTIHHRFTTATQVVGNIKLHRHVWPLVVTYITTKGLKLQMEVYISLPNRSRGSHNRSLKRFCVKFGKV